MADEPPPPQQPPWFSNQSSRAVRQLFLRDWELGCRSEVDNAHRMLEHAVRYSSTAIQTCYVLNGGALAALPPLMQGLPQAVRLWVPFVAFAFIVGIAFAGAASFTAYLNHIFNAKHCFAQAEQAARNINLIYGGAPAAQASTVSYQTKINWTLYVAVIAACLSLLSFIFGASVFLALAASFPAK